MKSSFEGHMKTEPFPFSFLIEEVTCKFIIHQFEWRYPRNSNNLHSRVVKLGIFNVIQAFTLFEHSF